MDTISIMAMLCLMAVCLVINTVGIVYLTHNVEDILIDFNQLLNMLFSRGDDNDDDK